MTKFALVCTLVSSLRYLYVDTHGYKISLVPLSLCHGDKLILRKKL